MFNCPGVHHAGCPDGASLALALGGSRWNGLSVQTLWNALTREGWHAGVVDSQAGGRSIPVLDPLCPTCGRALREELGVPPET